MSRIKIKLSLPVFYALAILPPLLALSYALLYSLGLLQVSGGGFTLEYWLRAIRGTEILYSFAYSLYISLFSVSLAFAGAICWILLYRSSGFSSFHRAILVFPTAIPPLVAAFITFRLFTKSGLFSAIAYQIGLIGDLQEFPDLVQDPWGIGIIITHAGMAFPLLTLVLIQVYKNENLDDLIQLGSTLGATQTQINTTIVFPLLFQGIRPTLVLFLIVSAGAYEAPLLLGRQSPQMASILVLRYLRNFDYQQRPMAFVVALLFSVMVLLVILGMRKIGQAQTLSKLSEP